jgi:hypothetical protein
MAAATIPRLFDLLALSTALMAAWLWYKASSCPTRRISLGETLDAQDFNRVVTAMNRSQILNRRAALASAASAFAVALKFTYDFLMTF